MPAFLAIAMLIAAGGSRRLAAQQPAAGSPPLLTTIGTIVEAPIRVGKVAGASIAVVKGGQTVVARSYGSADLELDVAMPPDATFEIGSATKQFTAAAILLLAERGSLNLDDEVGKFLPEVNTHGERVTIRHLLTHTSGIPGYTELPEFEDLSKQRKPREAMVALVNSKPLDFKPGDALVYNNTGYFLLGLVIEKITGQAYGDFVAKNLFATVGMTNSYYCSEESIRKRHAHGYDTGPQGLVLKGFIDHTWPYAAGSLCSSASDLATWVRALHTGKVLTPASYTAMTTPAVLNDGSKTRYAFGLTLTEFQGHRVIGHGGAIPGFLSETEYFPDDDLAIVVLQNTLGPAGPAETALRIAEAVLGPRPAPAAAASPDLAPYVGVYEGPGRGQRSVVTITAEGGRLMMTNAATAGRPAAPLTYQGGDAFTAGNARFVFDRPAGARFATRLRLDSVSVYAVLQRQPEPR